MKLSAPLVPVVAALALGACTAEQLATQSQSITLSEATDSVTWVVGKNDGNDIWPTGQGIRTAQIMIRKGPDRSDGPTFIAFVVWNGSVVGKIFRVRVGADGANFRGVVSNITSARTFGAPDFSTATAGNGGGGDGNPPLPRPHIDGECHFSADYLKRLKNRADTIENATADFLNDTDYGDKVAVPGAVSAP